MSIIFDTVEVKFAHKDEKSIKKWIKESVKNEEKKVGELAIVFTNDAHLLEINKQYLDHDYFTDIITFDYTEDNKISGDLMISLDTVKDNATTFNVDFYHELNRVIIHGVMHLCGYGDKKEDEEKEMREKENFYLSRLVL
jgi:rRNA maturation RNase YbeY